MARFVSEHTHNLVLHGFTVRQAEMDVNRVGCFVDFLYKVGLALFDGGRLEQRYPFFKSGFCVVLIPSFESFEGFGVKIDSINRRFETVGRLFTGIALVHEGEEV